MSPSDFDLLRHVRDETIFILNNTYKKTLEDVLNDEILCRAIIRSLEIVGEAARKISNDIKVNYPQIEWKKMAATRDRLTHDYFGVDYDIAWDIIQNKLPELQINIESIINSTK